MRVPNLFHRFDIALWFSFHGEREGDMIYLRCPCNHLKDGKCAIYETRPKLCADTPVGSPSCLYAIKRNRPNNWRDIKALMT